MIRAATAWQKPAYTRFFVLSVALVLASHSSRAGELEPATPAVEARDDLDPLFDDEFVGPQVPDPLEPVNRPVFAGNMAIDRVLIDPLVRFYGFVIPDPVRRSVRGVASNLNRPVVFVNELLQLSPRRAAQTLGRFVLNSSLGIAGLFDPAAELGWHEHEADFGQTLGKLGVGPGFYLVLPFLGPSTARDTIGTVVDTFLRVDTWFLPVASQLILGGGMGFTKAEKHREELAELRRSSLDYYAAVRSVYLQSREKLVREARGRRVFAGD